MGLGTKMPHIAVSFCDKTSKKCHSIPIPKIILSQGHIGGKIYILLVPYEEYYKL